MSTTTQADKQNDATAEPYGWMFAKDRGVHLLDTFKTIRTGLEGLRETNTTFKIKFLFDNSDKPSKGSSQMQEMLRYLGAWELSGEYYNSTVQRGKSWVNPNAKWAVKYSDVVEICPSCSALRLLPDKQSGSYHSEVAAVNEWCESDCPPDVRTRNVANIWENRRDVLEQAAEYCQSKELVSRRMGVAPNRAIQMAREMTGETWTDLSMRGYRRRRETWRVLRDEYGVYIKDIADAFGVSHSVVSEHTNGSSTRFQ